MMDPPPQVLSRKGASKVAGEAPKLVKTKTPPEGEKVVIRRLPPGMTEDEFTKILSPVWTSGKGKVGWFSYQPGKISRDPSKPSRPARAYLHVLRRDDLMTLSEAVRTATWEDAKETWNDPAMIGPPTTEFAMYKKVPASKKRSDGRQGTIDQDPEFMDFLEGLANPAVKKDGDAEQGAEEDGKLGGKATSTPLIDYLREKKANRAKEAASAKAAKHARHESQGGKGKSVIADEPKKKSKDSKGESSTGKPKETVKILTKKATADVAEKAKAVANQIVASKEDAPKSRRAGIALAARILQRDLGLSPGNAHRKARTQYAQAESEAKATAAKDTGASATASTSQQSPTISSQPSAPSAPRSQVQTQGSSPRGPRGKKTAVASESSKGKEVADKPDPAAAAPPKILLKNRDEAAPATQGTSGPASSSSAPPTGPKASQGKQNAVPAPKKGSAHVPPTPGAVRAFVKHANPSQGVTELLLKEAMQAFGGITFVEIDRRKGFAYVDFAEHDGLVQAIAASPIPVAQATVQVLERKDREGKKPAPAPSVANNAGSSVPAGTIPPTGPAADKSAGASSEHKRGGRRRGGRGRGDGPFKDGSSGSTKGQENIATSSTPPAAVTSAG